MSTHAYSRGDVFSDYLRAASGLAFALVPLVMLETMPAVTVLLVALALVFTLYGLTALKRHITRIAVDDHGLHLLAPAGEAFPWRSLTGVRLAYFSTRRDRTNGWLQLTMKLGRRRLRVDSRIGEFQRLAERVADAATVNRLPLDPATIFNFQAMGIAAKDNIAVESEQ
ncbi:MAG: hypothetical protein KIT00_07845 [Rhodospirillales bacterium]|nr:hypothetical protein [Rhodospirillales bacterium]